MSKFKVGDVVSVDGNNQWKISGIAKIVRFDENLSLNYTIDFIANCKVENEPRKINFFFLRDEHMKKLTEEEIKNLWLFNI